jgi:hypothetical protein
MNALDALAVSRGQRIVFSSYRGADLPSKNGRHKCPGAKLKSAARPLPV